MPLGAIAGAVIAGGATALGASATVAGIAGAAGAFGVSKLMSGGGGPSGGNVANTQLYEQQTMFGEQQGFEKQLEALMKDPSSVSKLPGYQFELGQGTQAVERAMGARFGPGSGAEAASLMQFGQGLAGSFYNQQASLLMQLAGLAPSSPAQLGGTATSAQSSNAAQQFQSMAGLGQLFSQNNPYSFGGSAGGGGGFNPAMNWTDATNYAFQQQGGYDIPAVATPAIGFPQ